MSESSSANETIIFTEKYARAVVGFCLTNQSFLRTCSENVKPLHLGTYPITSSLYEVIINSFKAVGKTPKKDDIIQDLLVRFPSKKDFDRYVAELELCITARQDVSFDHLKTQLSGWLKMIKVKSYIKQAADLYLKGKYAELDKLISDQSRKVIHSDFESDDRISMDGILQSIESLANDKESCCTLGHPLFDELFSPGAALPNWGNKGIKEATKGCLMPGDLTIFLGPSNSGKTTAMSTIIGSNLSFGKDVLVITHEERQEKLKLKFLQSQTQLKMDELNIITSPTVHNDSKQPITNKINTFEAIAQGQLYYYEWIKPGKMFVEDVLDHIQNVWDKKVDKTGRGFDLIVCDYPGKLRSRVISSKNTWDEKTYVYDQFLQLARNYRVHVVAPAQTNRQGYRVNKGAEDRLIDQGDMADAYGISQLADNIITINRSPDDSAKGIVKFHITKSRQSANGTTFVSKTDLQRALTHSLVLPALIIDPTREASQANGIIKENNPETISLVLGNLHLKGAAGGLQLAPIDVIPDSSNAIQSVNKPKPIDIISQAKPTGDWNSVVINKKDDDNKK